MRTALTTLKIAQVAPMPSASIDCHGDEARLLPYHSRRLAYVALEIVEEKKHSAPLR